MNKALPLVGILLFLVGSALILGSYSIFNQYGLSYSHDFPVGAYEEQEGTWKFPYPPLQLNEGDTVEIEVTINGSSYATLRIAAPMAGWEYEATVHENSTIYYYVQTNELYYFQVRLESGNPDTVIHTESRLEVHEKTPNEQLLVIGILALLGSFFTISTMSLYTKKT